MRTYDPVFHQRVYLFITSLFISSLVVSNLIIKKFFYWYPFENNIRVNDVGFFELSVGILPYPLTFLITDIVSEIYGRKKASQMVLAGVVASLFSLIILGLADFLPATQESPLSDELFKQVFSASPLAVIASMTAYLSAQTWDIYFFHYLKKLTKGRFLWIRNNISTLTSQFADTAVVITLLSAFGILPWKITWGLIVSGFIFKVMIAIIDTPLIYVIVFWYRRKYQMGYHDIIKIH